MLTLKTVATFALTALALAACSAGPEGTESQETTASTEAAQSAKSGGGVNATCTTDATCNRGLVCDPICPIIPGRPHCNIAGDSCQVSCNRPASSLSGTTFASADGAHNITFTSETEFSQTDGCPTSGIHCTAIKLTTGTYTSNGTTISLHGTLGSRDTMTVESHCYEGLIDNADGVELYQAASTSN